MSDVQDLIERLLTPAVWTAPGYCDVDRPLDPMWKAAADALAAQAAEIERLTPYVAAFRREEERADRLGIERDEAREERDRYLRHLTAGAQSINDYKARADAAEAEAEKLRAALRSIDSMVKEATRAPATADRWLDRIEDCARAALGQKP